MVETQVEEAAESWERTLSAARDEALLAVDLYNQSNRPRRLEAFFVHMHLAWLYLFQASYQRDGNPYIFLKNGQPELIDGEPKSWDLSKFARERWKENDPVRKNLELSILLRNKIEHRFEEAISVAVAGYAQALLLNFNNELTAAFGEGATLGSELRFPVFIGSFTREGAAQIAAAAQRTPSEIKKFLMEFESGLSKEVVEDHRFELRIHLIQKTGAKAEADVALTFVREADLTEDERMALAEIGKHGTTIIREQIREVVNAGKLKPRDVAKAVEARIPYKFSVYSHFSRACYTLAVRPRNGDSHPERTKIEYCVYDAPHKDYLYTEKFVDKLVEKASTRHGFKELTGIDPVVKSAEEQPS